MVLIWKAEDLFFKKRSVNISNHYLKALKGEVERSKDSITATTLEANRVLQSTVEQGKCVYVGGTLCRRKQTNEATITFIVLKITMKFYSIIRSRL